MSASAMGTEYPPMSAADVVQFYTGKTLFVTGATGLLGKAVLEKLLRAVPDIGTIYLLSRPGKGQTATERVQTEIVQSRIFEPLKSKLERNSPGNGKQLFNKLANKLIAVPGDMTSPKLGIEPSTLQKLSSEVDIVIHCAASINFDDRLDNALQLNTLGALEIHGMAESWAKVKSYVHISTAYVGANQHHGNPIPETVHKMDFDPKEVIRQVKENTSGGFMTLEQIRLRIMGHFPNTYTLTKCMTEVLLQERFESSTMPLAIVRPSIIGAAWSEPCPGWVDVVSAASAVFLAGGLGVVTILPGNLRGIADLVPLDHVVNHIILAGAENFNRQDRLHVSHACSSTANPVRWRVAARAVREAFMSHPPAAKLTPGPLKFRMINSPEWFALEWALKYSLPSRAYGIFASLSGSEKHKRQSDQLKLLTDKASYLVHLFTPFTQQEYIYCSDTMKRWIAWEHDPQLQNPGGPAASNPEDEICFSVDVLDVVWHQYFINYTYGLNRFILHEDLVPVSGTAVTHNNMKLTTDRLLQWDPDHHRISFPGLFPDLSWAYTSYRDVGYTNQGFFGRALGWTGWKENQAHEAAHVKRKTIRPVAQTLALVIKSPRVQTAIQQYADASNGKKSLADATKEAKKLLKEVASTLEDAPPRRFAWGLRKAWRKLFEGIRVHEAGLEAAREYIAAGEVPVVLLPTHRSYIDFLMLSFIFFAYNLPVPFIAADKLFSQMGGGVSKLLRDSGAFFLSRDGDLKKNPLLGAIFTEYFERLLEDKQTVEFFIEGTRSRSGKALEPKHGLLSMCLDPVLRGRVKDVIIVPIAIDYEKPLEVSLYADEMLGTGKQQETTRNLFKAATVLGSRFGHVSVQFGSPVSIADYLAQSPLLHGSSTLAELTRPLSFRVIQEMNRASLCMTIHLVATLVLATPHGITMQQLIPAVDWLRSEVRARRGDVVYVEGKHRRTIIEKALELLRPMVEETRGGVRVFQVMSHSKEQRNQHLLSLGYYRNKIVHLFAEESLWACALAASAARSLAGETRQQSRKPHRSLLGAATSLLMGTEQEGGLSGVDEAGSVDGSPSTSGRLSELTSSVDFLSKLLCHEFVGLKSLDPLATSEASRKNSYWSALMQLEESGVVEVATASSASSLQAVTLATTSSPSSWNLDASPLERYDENAHVVTVCSSPSAERVYGFLCNMVWPFLDSYSVAASALLSIETDKKVVLPNLVEKASMLAETLYADGLLKHFESCSVVVLQNAFRVFENWKVIDLHSQLLPRVPGKPLKHEIVVSLRSPYTDRKMLREFVSQLDSYRQPTSISSGFAEMRVTESPFLARL